MTKFIQLIVMELFVDILGMQLFLFYVDMERVLEVPIWPFRVWEIVIF